MSLHIPTPQPLSHEEQARATSAQAEERAKVGADLRRARFFARMSVDPDFKEVMLDGVLEDLYQELDQALDKAAPADLPGLVAQRKQIRATKEALHTALTSAMAKIGELTQVLQAMQKEAAISTTD